jgi:hypothetical protein
METFLDPNVPLQEIPVILDLSVINKFYPQDIVDLQQSDDIANIQMSDISRMF